MPKAKKVQARLLKKGDIVRFEGVEEVVRDVSVTISLSNGNNVSVPIHEMVEVVPAEQVPGRDFPEEPQEA